MLFLDGRFFDLASLDGSNKCVFFSNIFYLQRRTTIYILFEVKKNVYLLVMCLIFIPKVRIHYQFKYQWINDWIRLLALMKKKLVRASNNPKKEERKKCILPEANNNET